MPVQADGRLHVGFINVGQGDCTIIKFPDGKVAMIDCGSKGGWGNASYDSIRQDIRESIGGWPDQIELLILTHSDADHYNAVGHVLEDTHIKAIWHSNEVTAYSANEFTGWWHGSPTYGFKSRTGRSTGRLKGAANVGTGKLERLIWNTWEPGGSLELLDGSAGSVACRLVVLAADVDLATALEKRKEQSPDDGESGEAEGSESTKKRKRGSGSGRGNVKRARIRQDSGPAINTRSIVAVIEAKKGSSGQRIMIPGDATAYTEQFLFERYDQSQLKVDILRVPHHGASDECNTEAFVQATDPDIAVVSCAAENDHHHPRSSVIIGESSAGGGSGSQSTRQGYLHVVQPGTGPSHVVAYYNDSDLQRQELQTDRQLFTTDISGTQIYRFP